MITTQRPLIRLAGLALSAGMALWAAPAAFSETVAIPLGKQGDYWNIERPRTGASQQQVLSQFGAPLRTTGPVGEPPITTWVYEQFKVYFEYDHVIHSVVLHDK